MKNLTKIVAGYKIYAWCYIWLWEFIFKHVQLTEVVCGIEWFLNCLINFELIWFSQMDFVIIVLSIQFDRLFLALKTYWLIYNYLELFRTI